MQTIEVKIDQSLADIALQEYGSVNGIQLLLEDNAWLNGPTANIYPGDVLNVRETPLNKTMKTELSTAIIATVKGARGTGIGYMRIATNFIVK